jgi:hypothetical protein
MSLSSVPSSRRFRSFLRARRAHRRRPLVLEPLEPRLVLSTWVQQGPGPILDGQDEGLTRNPVSGAIEAVAPSATDPNLVYVGAVNGGIWKTTDATDASPVWVPLTDQQLPSGSINSLAISPLSATTLFAGTGSTSSLGFDGDPGFGVARSTDGGATWSVQAAATFAGRRIRSIVPTAATVNGNEVVLAGTFFDGGGVYSSSDGGTTFTRVSGGSGLPSAGVSDLVGDPGVATRFYAAVPSTQSSTSDGIYVSNNSGATWSLTTGTGLTGLATSERILLTVHHDASNDDLYAAVIDTTGHLSGVFRSANQGSTWTAMGVPSPEIFPGGQGNLHGAIVADPTDPTVVFISGDRQNSPFPNANGASNFSANVFRGVFAGTTTWQNVVMNGANGTSPHADSRAMAFDANGNILQGNDGGIFRLVTPNVAATRTWVSVNGNITPTEAHSAAYDSLSKVVFSGNQDTGTSIQSSAGSQIWSEFLQGDGGNVAVDTDQTAHPGTSIRYSSFTGLSFFNRSTWNSSNGFISDATVGLNITSGSGTGLTLSQFDPNIQFYNPFVLNSINPARMLIGTANIYESTNNGDSLTNLGFTGFFIGNGSANNPMDYGGRLNGIANPGIFYVGAGNTILHRPADGSAMVTLSAYPGGTVRSLVMDPQTDTHVFAVDTSNQVWASFDEGATWTNLTANLGTLSPSVRSITIFSPSSSPLNTVLVVGGEGGVFQMRRPGAAGTSWTTLSTGLPRTLVYDLRYNYTDNVLSAGTLGRGVWTLTGFFRGGGGTGLPTANAPDSSGTTDLSAAGTDLPPPILLSILPPVDDDDAGILVFAEPDVQPIDPDAPPPAPGAADATSQYVAAADADQTGPARSDQIVISLPPDLIVTRRLVNQSTDDPVPGSSSLI